MKNFRFLILAVAFLSQLVCLANEPLRYKFVKGETYVYTQKTVQDIEQQMMGQTVTTQQIMEADYSLKVLEVLPNAAKVEMIYKRMKNSTISPMATIVVDSHAGEEDMNPGNQILKAMTNKGFILEITNQGKIVKVEGLEKMKEAMLAEVSTDAGLKMQAEAMAKQFLNEETILETFKSALATYPEQALSVGGTWSEKYTNSILPSTVELTWTYTATDTFDAKVNYIATEKPQAVNGVMMSKVKGTGSHHVIVNEAMWAKEFTVKQEMSMEVSAQGMTIPMTIKSDTSIKLMD